MTDNKSIKGNFEGNIPEQEEKGIAMEILGELKNKTKDLKVLTKELLRY